MKKKLILPILILVLIFLTACGSKPDSAPAPTESAKVSETAAPKGDDKDDGAEIDYYSLCTEQSAKTVEGFAAEIKQQILDKDWEKLAENVSFPINVGTTSIPNKDEFIAADWDSILGDDFYDEIENESCENLFCNSEGIMLGNGQVWFAELVAGSPEEQGLKIIAINP